MNKKSNVSQIVMDDQKTNMIAAMIVLILIANFSNQTKFPFDLISVDKEKTAVESAGKVKTQEICIFKQDSELLVSFNKSKEELKEAKKVIQSVSTNLPVNLVVEKSCGLEIDEFTKIMGFLREKGVKHVSLEAQMAE